MLINGIRYYRNERDHITNLICNTAGVDSFYSHIVKKTIRSTETYLRNDEQEYLNDPHVHQVLCLYCYGVIMFLCEWLIKGAEESDEYVAEVCEKAVPELLRKYLLA